MEHILHCTGHSLKLPAIAGSKGIYVYDQGGRQYADLTSGVWCMPLGHNADRIRQVMADQAASLVHAGFCYADPIINQAGASVLSVTGLNRGKCVFLCSGSEAIEILRQIATCLAGRQKTLALHDAYFGSYSSAIHRGRNWHILNWEACRDCPKNQTCDPECAIIRAIPRDITEFLFEPGSASGFVRFPPAGLVRALVNRVRNSNGYIIANEVTTGMGRTGRWFGFQHYGIEPDMVALGKGIGNGYPVSVAVISQRIARRLDRTGFKYAQSHQNDPLGAAIAREVIQIMADDFLVRRSAQIGAWFLDRLQALVDNDLILAVRGKGLMVGMDLADPQTAEALQDHLLDKGFIVCNRGALFRIDPPLITPEKTLQGLIHAFASGITALKRPRIRPGIKTGTI